MKYRGRTEIVAMMLQAASSGATKTRIMYKAYLSYTQVKEYLKFLLDNHLLKYDGGAQIYKVTEKGRRFLHAYDEISDLVTTKSTDKILDFQ